MRCARLSSQVFDDATGSMKRRSQALFDANGGQIEGYCGQRTPLEDLDAAFAAHTDALGDAGEAQP